MDSRDDLEVDGEQGPLSDESPATTARQDEEDADQSSPVAANGSKTGDDPALASEFTLLVILQPDNVRHRVTVTPATTVGALTDALCSDLRLSTDLVTFPDLLPPAGQSYTDIPIAAFGLDGANNEERTVYAYVARRTERNSDYVMPDRIQVQVYDGGCGVVRCRMAGSFSYTGYAEDTSTYRTIVVDIEKFDDRKPYLGGYRSRKTQQIFHHASSQVKLKALTISYTET